MDFQPVASLIFASVVATWTCPVLSATAQNDAETQSTAFIAPDPIVNEVHSLDAGLVE